MFQQIKNGHYADNNLNDTLRIMHEGSGKPWATMQVLAAVPVKEPVANGFRVTREVTPVQEKLSGKVSRGDVWRVRLIVDSDQDMTSVVVNDPIPAGARILGEGDGRDSRIARSAGVPPQQHTRTQRA